MELRDFLVKAKKKTYAGGGKERKLRDGTRELIYEEGLFKYRDRYFGFNPFIGEELVWKNGRLIWGMNYYGTLISKLISEEQVYKFLKKALREVERERPFRGPHNFTERDFEYVNVSNGNLDFFSGGETILYKGEEVYYLSYHGGKIT